eukprot:COSAG01_NODE_64400_length_276_cov_1.463277_1_plen_70_part_10
MVTMGGCASFLRALGVSQILVLKQRTHAVCAVRYINHAPASIANVQIEDDGAFVYTGGEGEPPQLPLPEG